MFYQVYVEGELVGEFRSEKDAKRFASFNEGYGLKVIITYGESEWF